MNNILGTNAAKGRLRSTLHLHRTRKSIEVKISTITQSTRTLTTAKDIYVLACKTVGDGFDWKGLFLSGLDLSHSQLG